jgi:MFS family permease
MWSESRKIILTFSFCHFLLVFTYTILLAFLPPYFESVGIAEERIGSLVAASHIMTLPTVMIFGMISDRFSPRRLSMLGALLYTVYAFGASRAETFEAFLPLQMLGGVSYAICIVTLNSLYLKHLSGSHRGKKIGIFLMASYFGFGLGPLSAGRLATIGQLNWVFYAAGTASAVLFFGSLFLKDYPIKPFRLGDYVKDIRSRRSFLIIFCMFAEGMHVGAEHTSYTLLMKHHAGMTAADIGLFYFLMALWIAFLTYSIGHWVDKDSRWIKYFLSGGMLMSGIFQILTGTAESFLGLLIIRDLHLFGDAFMMWALTYFISMIFPDDRLGGNFGFTRVVNTVGISLGALLFGASMGFGGYSMPFYLSGVFQLGIAVFFFTQREYLDVSHHKYASAAEVAAARPLVERPMPKR